MAKRKQKKGINLITLVIAIIIIVLVVIFIKNIVSKNKNKENTNSTTTEEKYVQTLDDGTKLNTSEKLKKDKEVEDLELKNIQLTYKNGVTNLLCDIQNNSKKEVKMEDVEIVLLDENGDTIYKMRGFMEEIKPGETKQFNSSITADFSNAYDFKINKK